MAKDHCSFPVLLASNITFTFTIVITSNRQHTPSSTLRLIISFSLGGRYSLPYDGMAVALAFLGTDDGKPSPTGGPHGLPRLESQNEHEHAETL